MRFRRIVLGSLLGSALAAQALTLTGLTPQGEVAQVRQVVAKFDSAVITFGDPKAPAPLELRCSDAQVSKGTGRWTSEREWVYDFERDLPPGVRCTAHIKSDFKSASGAPLKGAASYQFNSGGPFVQQIRPGTYEPIEEEQYFVLQLNGPATPESVAGQCLVRSSTAWASACRCAWSTASRVPPCSRPRAGANGGATEPLALATLACNRRLTPLRPRCRWCTARAWPRPAACPMRVEKRLPYQVREPFTANSAASARTPRPPACRSARSR
jgi:hypothetical protein